MSTYMDLAQLRQTGDDWVTSRPLAELRRPKGLPLPFVELYVPITKADLTKGSQWPPQRGMSRQKRMNDQWSAARGDYSRWLPEYKPDLAFNPIAAYVDDVRAIMMASHPAEEQPVPKRKAIRRAIGRSTWDLIIHGEGVFAGNDDTVTSWPIRYGWPFVDDTGYAFVVPAVSTKSKDGTCDVIDVWVVADGAIGGYRAGLEGCSNTEAYGTIGDTIETYAPVDGNWSNCSRPPVDYKWGKPHADELIPIAVAYARRESGADYALDRFEVPHYEITQADADAGANFPGSEHVGDSPQITPLAYRQMAPSLNEHDVVVIGGGKRSGGFKQATLSTGQALDFLDRLDQRWSQQTGQQPMESGDAGNEESGVAFARKQVRLVARSREIHEAERDALYEVIGEFGWDYVGTMLGSTESPMTGSVDPIAGDPGLEEDPDGDI